MNTSEKIRRIARLLTKAYGRPKPLRKADPIDELIRTVLSQNTTDKNSLKAFSVLKKTFNSWNGALEADTRRIARLIWHAGLANIKAKRIKDVLGEIRKREGKLTLSSLKGLSVEDSLQYLRSLKGVGPKTAACVLLFSLGKPVMPVDTHIFRVTKRLGLIDDKVNIEEAHSELSKKVPAGLIYNFHLGIIEHGRRTCHARNPACCKCVIYNLCKYERKSEYKRLCNV